VSGFAVIRAADHRVMRWKNGGGETAEVLIWPAGATLDDFDWRLSMARVEADGPFSAFPGIDRTLAVLEGEGIRLVVGDDSAVTLTQDSPPFAFAADRPAAADLVGGPIVDLNMMSRRGRVAHTMTRLVLDGAAAIELSDAGTLVFCAEGEVAIQAVDATAVLGRRDTLMCFGVIAAAVLRPQPTALIYVTKIVRG
jgi:environmental stress-induced protein Ves